MNSSPCDEGVWGRSAIGLIHRHIISMLSAYTFVLSVAERFLHDPRRGREPVGFLSKTIPGPKLAYIEVEVQETWALAHLKPWYLLLTIHKP